MTEPLLEVEDLTKHFPITAGLLRRTVGLIKAVDGVSFNIGKGETLGLVGESGCGKTTTGRLILRVLERTRGAMVFHLDGRRIDLGTLRGDELRRFRTHMQLIFQDPFASLNPRMTILDLIAEPLRALENKTRDEIESRVRWLVEQVGLKVEFLRRYPHAFSGGQRQRIGIARALAVNPELIICDEPVSALDVSVQAQILNLLESMKQRYGLTLLFIAHDLAVVKNVSDRVVVMYLGKICEVAGADQLYGEPVHPYTQLLLQSIPAPDPDRASGDGTISGDLPSPIDPPSGCRFRTRCPLAQDVCAETEPELRELRPGHFVACHFAEESAVVA